MPKKITSVVIDGVEYSIPRFVSRVDNGWQVRVSPTKYFADQFHKGQAGSLAAAIKYRFSILPEEIQDKVGNFKSCESSDKEEPTGMPGVFWRHNKDVTKRIEVRANKKGKTILYASQIVRKGDESNALSWAKQKREEQIASWPEQTSLLGRLAQKIFG